MGLAIVSLDSWSDGACPFSSLARSQIPYAFLHLHRYSREYRHSHVLLVVDIFISAISASFLRVLAVVISSLFRSLLSTPT